MNNTQDQGRIHYLPYLSVIRQLQSSSFQLPTNNCMTLIQLNC